ncbi:hypothetical protein BDP67DRAFT_155091 [Colletotrichum lupini]|nr:hypothetical protein BDP67DRAFT_155091 [Colletotrichum lupini]
MPRRQPLFGSLNRAKATEKVQRGHHMCRSLYPYLALPTLPFFSIPIHPPLFIIPQPPSSISLPLNVASTLAYSLLSSLITLTHSLTLVSPHHSPYPPLSVSLSISPSVSPLPTPLLSIGHWTHKPVSHQTTATAQQNRTGRPSPLAHSLPFSDLEFALATAPVATPTPTAQQATLPKPPRLDPAAAFRYNPRVFDPLPSLTSERSTLLSP